MLENVARRIQTAIADYCNELYEQNKDRPDILNYCALETQRLFHSFSTNWRINVGELNITVDLEYTADGETKSLAPLTIPEVSSVRMIVGSGAINFEAQTAHLVAEKTIRLETLDSPALIAGQQMETIFYGPAAYLLWPLGTGPLTVGMPIPHYQALVTSVHHELRGNQCVTSVVLKVE